MVSILKGNRTFRYTIGIWTLGILAMSFPISTGVYFLTYVMGYDKHKAGVVFGVIVLGTFVYIPLINFVAKKWSKRNSYIFFSGIWLFFGILALLFIKGPENQTMFWISVVTAGSISCILVYQLGWSMIPDVTEVDELIHDKRREGLYFGVMALIQKVASGLALQLVGILLAWFGYNAAAAEQSSRVLFGIRCLNFGGPIIFIVLSIVIAYFMPMTPKRHGALREILELKKQGKDYDINRVKDLL